MFSIKFSCYDDNENTLLQNIDMQLKEGYYHYVVRFDGVFYCFGGDYNEKSITAYR